MDTIDYFGNQQEEETENLVDRASAIDALSTPKKRKTSFCSNCTRKDVMRSPTKGLPSPFRNKHVQVKVHEIQDQTLVFEEEYLIQIKTVIVIFGIPLIFLPLLVLDRFTDVYLDIPFMIWGMCSYLLTQYCNMIFIIYIPDHILNYQFMNYNTEIWGNTIKIIYIMIFVFDTICPNVHTNDTLYVMSTMIYLMAPFVYMYILKGQGEWKNKIRFYVSAIVMDTWPSYVYLNYRSFPFTFGFNLFYGIMLSVGIGEQISLRPSIFFIAFIMLYLIFRTFGSLWFMAIPIIYGLYSV
jgi:hypothetical protein